MRNEYLTKIKIYTPNEYTVYSIGYFMKTNSVEKYFMTEFEQSMMGSAPDFDIIGIIPIENILGGISDIDNVFEDIEKYRNIV